MYESKKKYNAKYNKRTYFQQLIRFRKDSESQTKAFNYLSHQIKKSEYIINLILRDIEKKEGK